MQLCIIPKALLQSIAGKGKAVGWPGYSARDNSLTTYKFRSIRVFVQPFSKMLGQNVFPKSNVWCSTLMYIALIIERNVASITMVTERFLFTYSI